MSELSNKKSFYSWIKERKMVVFIISILCGLCYAKYIFGIYFYQDAGVILFRQGTTYNWLGIGRYGLVIIRKIFGTDMSNPYFEAILFLVTFILLVLFWMFFMEKLTAKSSSDFKNIVFGAIFLTYPLWTEQVYFQFQSFEILIGYLLTSIALYFLFFGVKEHKYLYKILAIATAILAFGIYQSFVNVFITGCVGMYLLSLKKDTTFKKFISVIVEYIVVFVISFVIYELLCHFFFSSSDYLSGQIMWGKQSASSILLSIRDYFINVLLGKGSFFPYTYLIVSILVVFACLLIIFINFKKSTGTYVFVTVLVSLVLLLSPFLLALFTGMPTINRGQLALPLAVAIGYFFVFTFFEENIKIYVKKFVYCIALAGVISVLWQTNDLMRIFYTYDIISESDKIKATKISYDLDKVIAKEGNLPIAFIGSVDAGVNPACCDTSEWSYLFDSNLLANEVLEPHYYWSGGYITGWYGMYGINYVAASREQVVAAIEESKNMNIWPNEGGIKVKDGIIIIKLSEILE